MSKIIFIDIDGTLVNYSNELPQSAVQAIRKARKNGHKAYLCSGRSKAENKQEIWDIGIDGYIGGNGNYIESDKKVIMHRLITQEQCARIVDWLNARNLEFYLESNNGLFAGANFKEKALPVLRKYHERKGKPNNENVSADDAFLSEMIYGANLYRDDVNKVSFILNDYNDHIDSAKEFTDLTAGTWGGAGETALFGDLCVKDITKKFAVETLINYLGANIKDTIAFGDAKADIPMFECCAKSVCMGSGGEEAKLAADYVTDDVDNDGLYKAFERLRLI